MTPPLLRPSWLLPGRSASSFPPSITFVVYGSISDTSIGDLFISGVVPGLLMGAALVIITLWLGRKSDLQRLPRRSGAERWKAFKGAFWGLLMPVSILGGIDGIAFPQLGAGDVVRHSLVSAIVEAYDDHDAAERERAERKKAAGSKAEGSKGAAKRGAAKGSANRGAHGVRDAGGDWKWKSGDDE